VGTEDRDGTGSGTVDPGDHRELGPRVDELFDCNFGHFALRGDLGELIEDPLGRLLTGS